MASVAHCRQVHPRVLFFNLDALEFGVVELSCVLLILDSCWAHLVFEISELLLAELLLSGGLVLVVQWGHTAGIQLVID